jgi:GGDEF domain-containing protein
MGRQADRAEGQAEVKELLEAADAAMYKIKQERREKFGIKAR